MRKSHITIAAAALGLVAALVYGPPAWQRRREAIREVRERDWTQKALHQLERTPPPSAELGQATNGTGWITPDYLVFSNGWVAYKMHSMHANDGVGDLALLRSSDGALYWSHFHFCYSIAADFRVSMQSGDAPRPKDLKEFLEKYATTWRPYVGN